MSINSAIQTASLKISREKIKYNPSSLISLYEFDFTELGNSKNDMVISTINYGGSIAPPYQGLSNIDDNGILRFHNLNINLESLTTNLSNGKLFGQIIWKGKRYIPFPFETEGYEISTRGTLPKPKIIFSNQTQVDQYDYFFRIIKNAIRSVGDIIGLKITRRRTFLKFLDAVNFKSGGGIIDDSDFIIDPNSLAELPQDVYFIDRKLRESKNSLEYEMSSILDLENIRLPLRTMYAESCSFDYRGEGCEYNSGNFYTNQNHADGRPVATDQDKDMITILGIPNVTAGSPLQWIPSTAGVYQKGQYVFILVGNIKYFFVAKVNNLDSSIYPPTNITYWYQDLCSKRLSGCRKRYNRASSVGLPFGGFPSTTRET